MAIAVQQSACNELAILFYLFVRALFQTTNSDSRGEFLAAF